MLQYHHYIELLALIIGTFCFDRTWKIYYKILFFLVVLTFLVEIVGYTLAIKYGNNTWLYNIFSPIECLIILYFFSSILLKRKLKEILRYSIPLMLLATVVTYFVQPHFSIYNHYARTIYIILWIIACCFFFIDVMVNNNRMELIKQPGFWLATGVLFFSVIFVFLVSLHKILSSLPNYKIIFGYFNVVANTFMYVGLSGVFICQHIATKYYSPSSQPA